MTTPALGYTGRDTAYRTFHIRQRVAHRAYGRNGNQHNATVRFAYDVFYVGVFIDTASTLAKAKRVALEHELASKNTK